MPLFFIGTGIVLVFVGLNGNAAKFYGLLVNDFSGPKSFVYWFISILVLGALGYIKGLEQMSKLFLILVIIVLLLDNGGFFAQFQAYLKQTQTGGTAPTTSTSSLGGSPVPPVPPAPTAPAAPKVGS